MVEIPSTPKKSLEKPSRRGLFFSPKIREESDEARVRAGRLNKGYVFERDDLAVFEELAGDDDYVTLGELFQIAEEASASGSRAKLVALKRLSQSLLNDLYQKGNDHAAQAEVWDYLMPKEHRLKARAAEMIILKAEMEYLKLRQKEGTLHAIPSSQADALARQFRHYARNVDIPADFQKELLAAHKMIKPVQAAVQETFQSHESALEDHKTGDTETVAIRSASEETQINTDILEPEPSPIVRAQKRVKRYRELDTRAKNRVRLSAGPKLAYYQDGISVNEMAEIDPYLPQAVEYCVERGDLPEKYWSTALYLLGNELQGMGLLDSSLYTILLDELPSQLQYALHSNQLSGLRYWLTWKIPDWLGQSTTRARIFTPDGLVKGAAGLLTPNSKANRQKLREMRGNVAEAARRVVKKFTSRSQPPLPEERVVMALLELVANELENVSRLGQEQEEAREAAKVGRRDRRKKVAAALWTWTKGLFQEKKKTKQS